MLQIEIPQLPILQSPKPDCPEEETVRKAAEYEDYVGKYEETDNVSPFLIT